MGRDALGAVLTNYLLAGFIGGLWTVAVFCAGVWWGHVTAPKSGA